MSFDLDVPKTIDEYVYSHALNLPVIVSLLMSIFGPLYIEYREYLP